ncbi:MAG: hypothetical protein A7315_13565 [Candidatus Altiarchaeales archaeon WOR_SM1_79]|nr:MAG: hypothetical protein A7315_13565 [Candidatus Altiarchaeales archaeon WOR_SM1_79]
MTAAAITAESVIEALPGILEKRPEIRYKFYAIIEEKFPSREETNRILEEIKSMREESNKRFDAMHEEIMSIKSDVSRIDDRVTRMDDRVTRMDDKVTRMDNDMGEIKKSQKEISVSLLPFMRRGGYHFEDTVKGVIEMALKIKDGKIEHFTEEIDGEEIERDAYVHNGEKILFEIKSRVQRRDVSYFIRDIKLVEQKLGKVRPVMIGFLIDESALEYCNKAGIEVINPDVDLAKEKEARHN